MTITPVARESLERLSSLMEILIADLVAEEGLIRGARPASAREIQTTAVGLAVSIRWTSPSWDAVSVSVIHAGERWRDQGDVGRVVAAAREHILTVAARRADR